MGRAPGGVPAPGGRPGVALNRLGPFRSSVTAPLGSARPWSTSHTGRAGRRSRPRSVDVGRADHLVDHGPPGLVVAEREEVVAETLAHGIELRSGWTRPRGSRPARLIRIPAYVSLLGIRKNRRLPLIETTPGRAGGRMARSPVGPHDAAALARRRFSVVDRRHPRCAGGSRRGGGPRRSAAPCRGSGAPAPRFRRRRL